MRGDSRHAPSRTGRAGRRDNGAASQRRERGADAVGGLPGPEPAELARLLEPVTAAAGLDLESVRVSAAGRRRLLRVVVDADGGVGLDAIAEVSRQVSKRLDASGAMGEVPYTLEVSSPGVDRPLTEPRHWRRARGRLVSVALAAAPDGPFSGHTNVPAGRETVCGRVLVASDLGVTLEIEGARREFAYAELGPGQVQVELGKLDDSSPAEAAGAVTPHAAPGGGGSRNGH
jgi:ribosome maturation factor RimP